MNAIHDIPETNGSHSQPLYRALKKKSSQKYKFLTDLYSAKKKSRVFKAFHFHAAKFPPDLELQYKPNILIFIIYFTRNTRTMLRPRLSQRLP